MKNNMTDELKVFVSEIIKKIVDNPKEVEVECVVSTKSIILQIKALQIDYGKIIGRKGQTIESIKILTAAIKNTNFEKDSRKIFIEVLEEDE
jgi:predicted RNA-binding protein YlqC (UPF0109 family)